MIKTKANNRLIQTGQYSRVINLYNRELQRHGKVNKSQFFREYIEPFVPNYSMESWFTFARRIEKDVSLIVARDAGHMAVTDPTEASAALMNTLLSSAEATRLGVARMLKIGEAATEEILANPNLLSVKDRAKFLIYAMKAQDSRIQATTSVRRDTREQVQFEHVFGDEAYVEENN